MARWNEYRTKLFLSYILGEMLWSCFVLVAVVVRPHADSLSAEGVRLNKCLVGLSRRAADAAIQEGRVSVDGEIRVDPGFRCLRDDQVVTLDGVEQGWASVEAAKKLPPGESFVYVKYWKPRGVTCTTDRRVRGNVIESLGQDFGSRIFPVGRLDKESTGLILLTSDGRLCEKLLRPSANKVKEYEVEVDPAPSRDDVSALSSGIVVTTVAQRDRGRRIPLTAPTKPCKVDVISPNKLRIALSEGRNRQIRRMCAARGLTVVDLHRITFAGITLRGLKKPGDRKRLDAREMDLIRRALAVASPPPST